MPKWHKTIDICFGSGIIVLQHHFPTFLWMMLHFILDFNTWNINLAWFLSAILVFITWGCLFEDYLSFQIADLESEDGKKDTMVDLVFKKALKEFRINIFNSYSTALAVSPLCSSLSFLFSFSSAWNTSEMGKLGKLSITLKYAKLTLKYFPVIVETFWHVMFCPVKHRTHLAPKRTQINPNKLNSAE